jgi:hypothetical protein
MSIQPADWTDAWKLDDYVISLFERKETHTNEFQTLLKIFGRPKLEKIWKDYRERKKHDQGNGLQAKTCDAER